MSELLKKQKFGVEVEFTGITRTMAAEAVAEILGSHATGPDRTCYRTYTIRDSKRRIWKVMRDSSICPVRKGFVHGMYHRLLHLFRLGWGFHLSQQ